jgi:hypothetical protein
MDDIDLEKVAEKYNSLKEIWPRRDHWHQRTYLEICKFIDRVNKNGFVNNQENILNAGSGGNSYNLSEGKMLHVDIAKNKIQDKEHFLVANVENLPLSDNSFNFAICVGSVINYCDPIKVIQEFERLLINKSFLVLEFENSISWEFIGTNKFSKKATIVTTFYDGNQEKLWVFSEKYILDLLKINNFSLVKIKRLHLLSPLFYKLIRNENISSKLASIDKIANLIPFLKIICSNVIILAQKTRIN